MPIEVRCPGCKKLYRLKDELAGKKAKCSNADCRTSFAVPLAPVAVGAGSGKAPVIDAETLAAQLFAEDDPNAKPIHEQQLNVECQYCNHKWTEPASKAGKFALCPECRTRTKIPELKAVKAADWRDPNSGRRSLEKGPELPKDLAEQQMRDASIDSLKGAGAIAENEVEPRPVWQIVMFFAVPILLLGLLVGAGFWYFNTRSQGEDNQIMAEAVKEIAEIKDDSKMPKDQPKLLRALLHLSNAEYQTRLNTPESIKLALRSLGEARKELEAAPKSPERDLLFTDVALGLVNLGGTPEQVGSQTRLAWSQANSKAPPVGNTKVDYVQEEIRRLFTAMVAKEVGMQYRLRTLRRVGKEFAQKGHADILFEVYGQMFGATPEEQSQFPEAQASLILVVSTAVDAEDRSLKQQVESFKQLVKSNGDKFASPPSTLAVFHKFNITDLKPTTLPAIAGQQASVDTRLAYSALYLVQDKPTEAVSVCTGIGGVADRLTALANLSEIAADPKPAIEAAAKMFPDPKGDQYRLFQLATNAARAGMVDAGQPFAKAIPDEGLRELAFAELLKAKWTASKQAASTADLPKPSDVTKLRLGHAWGCRSWARHNASLNSDKAQLEEFKNWESGELRGFGYAGFALGLQDR